MFHGNPNPWNPILVQSLYAYAILYMGGCQNDGPFLDPYYNTAPNI